MEPPNEVSARYLKGVGPKRAEILERLGIRTAQDVLFHFPRDYIDRSAVIPIEQAQIGERVTIKAQIASRRRRRLRNRSMLVEAKLDDGTGVVYATWFNQPYVYDRLQKGDTILAHGKVTVFEKPQIVNPEYDIVTDDTDHGVHAGRIVPVYPLTENFSQTLYRRIAQAAVDGFASDVVDMFDDAYLERRGLLPLARALQDIHFPRSWALAERARNRLVYDELFLLQVGMALRRRGIKDDLDGIKFAVPPTMDRKIRRLFPFELTGSQNDAIDAIVKDMRSARPMNRLLQGEVGSGKTVVAVYAMLAAVANEWQVSFMAPTEILAEQHFRTISRMLRKSRVRMALLIGGRPRKERAAALQQVEAGEIDLVVGTHAVIQKDVAFRNLGLVVVDEQHKFGVLQRAGLRGKGANPDVLVMTATPIPRTLALTVFGDLDVTTIKELPSGRRPVVTRVVTRGRCHQAYEFIGSQLAKGRQAFFVCPLIEESDKLNVKSAEEMFERLRRDVFPRFKLRLLHGRMKSEEKDEIMLAFAKREFDMLIATVVIEVGIDIPNATVMAIENAERFGLSQLHQLRGRIGRGPHRSYCLLFPGHAGTEAMERLNVVASTTDGFTIAEEDLRLRGPGEFFGTRQHGLPELVISDLGRDFDILTQAHKDAIEVVGADPDLRQGTHPVVSERVREKFRDRLDLIRVG